MTVTEHDPFIEGREIPNSPDLIERAPDPEAPVEVEAPPAASNGHAKTPKQAPTNDRARPVLPHDTDTERALLRAATAGAAHILQAVTDDLWYTPAHVTIAHAISAVADEAGQVDPLILLNHLKAQGLDELVGGPGAIAEIQASPGWPESADRYVQTLEEHRQARQLITAAEEAAAAAREGRLGAAQQLLEPVRTQPRAATLAAGPLTATFDQPPKHPTTIVQGLIHHGEMCAIAAPRAIGKSWFGMNLAVLAAQGRGELAGTLPIRTATNVLYCHGELDHYGAYARWYRMTTGQPPGGLHETFDRWRIRTVDRRTPAPGGGTDTHIEGVLDPRLEQYIETNKIGLIVIDPWAVYFAGKENSNDETEAALDKLRDLALRHQTAIVLIHHISAKIEPGRIAEPEDLWRGATRLADWASTRVTILRHYTDAAAREVQLSRQDARRFVDVKLLRRGEPTPDFSMRMNYGSGWWEPWNPPGRPEGAIDPAKNPPPEDVAAKCAADGGWDSLRTAAAALGVSRDKASELCARAVHEGLLQTAKGERGATRYQPTEPTEEAS